MCRIAAGMHYTFEPSPDHLRAELFGRRTIEDTLAFIDALIAEARRLSVRRFLVWVRTSRPIFKVERLSDSFKRLKEQIDARDDFLTRRGRSSLGLSLPNRSSNGS